ncbi:MAG: DJ-1/PfpI family protein [Haloarculaceae archaeon]
MTDATVGVLVYEGVEELDALGPYDVFATAGANGAPVGARLLAVDAGERLTASKGLRFEPHGPLPDPGSEGAPDFLVVPGGGWNARADRGAWAEAERGRVPDAIAAHHAAGATVLSVCTGAMLLARAGLLAGRPATTHGAALEDLRATDARARAARVVDDGDVVTAGGVTSGLDAALWLVEREWGADVAAATADSLAYERRGGVYRA